MNDPKPYLAVFPCLRQSDATKQSDATTQSYEKPKAQRAASPYRENAAGCVKSGAQGRLKISRFPPTPHRLTLLNWSLLMNKNRSFGKKRSHHFSGGTIMPKVVN